MSERSRLALVALVAIVWLNQAPILGAFGARSPLRTLYGTGGDERLLFATSGAIVGKPFDAELLATSRGGVPSSFSGAGITPGAWNLPYRDVPLEYPPLNLPLFVLPRLFASNINVYALLLGALMGAFAVLAARAGAAIRRQCGEGSPGEKHALNMAVLLLLAQGALVTQRLDAVVALVWVLFVAAFIDRRDFAIGVFAGLLFAVKLLPVLVLPVLLAVDLHSTRRSAGAWRSMAAGFAVAVAIGFGLVVLASEALDQFLGYHARRGLQVESTLAVAYSIIEVVLGRRAATRHDFGSFNLDGETAGALARASLPLMLVAVAAIVFVVRRAPGVDGHARARRIVATAYATMIVLWLTGKVFSPQYLTWGLPLAIALWGRGRAAVVALTGAAMAVSQIYFRLFYPDILMQSGTGLTLLVLRQIVLIGLLVVLVRMAKSPPRAIYHRPQGSAGQGA